MRIQLPSRARLRAVVRQRCPQCLEGEVFTGMIRMKERCTLCGHQFGREQGYFQGAMYLSYALALFTLGLLATVGITLLPSHSPLWAMVIAIAIFLPLVPVLFRYSRIIWMHLFYYAF